MSFTVASRRGGCVVVRARQKAEPVSAGICFFDDRAMKTVCIFQSWDRLLVHAVTLAWRIALAMAGSNKAARIPMMTMTTSSSIKVNPPSLVLLWGWPELRRAGPPSLVFLWERLERRRTDPPSRLWGLRFGVTGPPVRFDKPPVPGDSVAMLFLLSSCQRPDSPLSHERRLKSASAEAGPVARRSEVPASKELSE